MDLAVVPGDGPDSVDHVGTAELREPTVLMKVVLKAATVVGLPEHVLLFVRVEVVDNAGRVVRHHRP